MRLEPNQVQHLPQYRQINSLVMVIKETIKQTSLSENEAVDIKGGINSYSMAVVSSCTDCNCWFSNENKKDKSQTPVKQSTLMTD